MKYFDEFQFDVDEKAVSTLLNQAKSGYPEEPDRDVLLKIFSLIDLTSLSEKDNTENIGNCATN